MESLIAEQQLDDDNHHNHQQQSSSLNTLAWHNIKCNVPHRTQKGSTFEILHGVSGLIHGHQMLGIVGPSGAGKSCFLDVLCMRKSTGTINGTITYNGRALTPTMLSTYSSYVTQSNVFFPTQTVLEAVLFQAHMRLSPSIPYATKVNIAEGLISMAGLQGKEHRHIGGMLPGSILVPGLSGGEQRRLSLCCAIISNPHILFADEPTSGLDSLAALMIMKLLRGFVDQGIIVICTIHQPRQAIWGLFHKVMVLGKGHELYYGSAGEAEEWFTTRLGLTVPRKTSPVDFILDLCNIDFDKSSLYDFNTLNTMQDLEELALAFRKSHADLFLQSAAAAMSNGMEDEEEETKLEGGGLTSVSSISNSSSRRRQQQKKDDEEEEEEAMLDEIKVTDGPETRSSGRGMPTALIEDKAKAITPPPLSSGDDDEEGKKMEELPMMMMMNEMTTLSSILSYHQQQHHHQASSSPLSSNQYMRKEEEEQMEMQMMMMMTKKMDPPSWFYKYRVLLQRNARNYIRNYGNVAARTAITTGIALFIGLVYFQVGRNNNPTILQDLLVGLFFDIFTIFLIPFCSQSSFLYDRQFFQSENAAGIYPVSAYYLANVTLELVVNTVNGVIFASLIYNLVGWNYIAVPADPVATMIGFIGIMVLATHVGNSLVVFSALASPNQEIAFLVAAGYVSLSAMAGGVLSYPNLNQKAKWVQYLSAIKYPYQGLLLFLFKGNPRATNPFGTVESFLHLLEFDNPPEAWQHILACFTFYLIFSIGGYLSLKYLYKEKR